MPFVLQTTLIGLVLLAAVTDLRSRRIPNWLTASGLVLGLGLNSYLFQGHGAFAALEGFGLALLVYVPFYCLRGMGAGDVKLMAAVGTIAGPAHWFTIFLATAIAGGVLSLAVILYKRRLAHTLLNLSCLLSELLHLRRPAEKSPELHVGNANALRMPHAVPIALGSLTFLLLFSSLA